MGASKGRDWVSWITSVSLELGVQLVWILRRHRIRVLFAAVFAAYSRCSVNICWIWMNVRMYEYCTACRLPIPSHSLLFFLENGILVSFRRQPDAPRRGSWFKEIRALQFLLTRDWPGMIMWHSSANETQKKKINQGFWERFSFSFKWERCEEKMPLLSPPTGMSLLLHITMPGRFLEWRQSFISKTEQAYR